MNETFNKSLFTKLAIDDRIYFMTTTIPTLPLRILTKQEFALDIERRVYQKGMGYLEAIVDYCEHAHIEPEEIQKLIVGSLKEKIKAEAQANCLLPKSSCSLFV